MSDRTTSSITLSNTSDNVETSPSKDFAELAETDNHNLNLWSQIRTGKKFKGTLDFQAEVTEKSIVPTAAVKATKSKGFAPSSRNQRRTKRKATLQKSHKPPKYRLILRELREDGSIAPEIYHQEVISEAQAVSGRYIPKLIQWNQQRINAGLLPLVSRLEKLEGGEA